MSQEKAWEREYRNPQLITKDDKPQKDVLRFFKFLKKDKGMPLENLKILDLGSGVGRNSNYLAEMGNNVVGFEISKTAIKLAEIRAKSLGLDVDYQHFNIGAVYNFEDNLFDLVLDITSSNALNKKERDIYLSEVFRVLKPGGYFFVRGLCKDGDKNAKKLIKISPGSEKDTYINKEMGLTEKIFSRDNFVDTYSKYFKIIELFKKTGYTKFGGQSYKRNFWLAYMQKK